MYFPLKIFKIIIEVQTIIKVFYYENNEVLNERYRIF